MKNIFRFVLVALALASTCLFAQAATAPSVPVHQKYNQSVKIAKKRHKKHRKHKKTGV